jgi:hypothetical protein
MAQPASNCYVDSSERRLQEAEAREMQREEGRGISEILHCRGAHFGTQGIIKASLIVPVRFEVFQAVTRKNGFFCDVTPCGSCKNRHFGGT